MSRPDRTHAARKIVSAARVVIETATMSENLFPSDDQQFHLARSVERMFDSIKAYPPWRPGIDEIGDYVGRLGGVVYGIMERWLREEADALYERYWTEAAEERANWYQNFDYMYSDYPQYDPDDALEGDTEPPPPHSDPILIVTADEIARLRILVAHLEWVATYEPGTAPPIAGSSPEAEGKMTSFLEMFPKIRSRVTRPLEMGGEYADLPYIPPTMANDG
jgi:hypothetical protein